MKKSNKTAMAVKKIAGVMAELSCGAASIWSVYQPKEPKSPKTSK